MRKSLSIQVTEKGPQDSQVNTAFYFTELLHYYYQMHSKAHNSKPSERDFKRCYLVLIANIR